MGLLKRANKNEVTRYQSEDGEDYIDMRSHMTKGEANDLAVASPTVKQDADGKDINDVAGGLKFVEKFFIMTTTAWSLRDESGEPIAPSIEAYRDLTPEAGRWIDEQISAHIQVIFGPKAADLEGKDKS